MKRMLIDALHPEEMRVAITDNKQILEFDFVSSTKKQVKGNIYLAKITRVEPSLQAAFVEYGGGKQGFLPFAEIHPDYYQIPVSDRKKLMEEVERELAAEADDDEDDLLPSSPAAGQDEAETTGEEPAAEAASAGDMMDELSSRTDNNMPADTTQYARSEDDSVASQPLDDMSRPVVQHENHALEMQPDTVVSIGAVRYSEEISVDHAAQESADAIDDIQQHAEAAAEQENSDVETISSEEESARQRRKKSRVPFFKRYKIQEVVKRGQIVLVQVIKEERGNKGVSLTTYLSLAGRYCVLMPNSPRDGGVSRKISDIDTRRRLKEVMAQLKLARGMSVIIRTAGIDRSKPEIRRDFDYLVKLWNRIREETLTSTAPALIYEENNLIKRAIRDQYTSDIEEVLVEGAEGYQEAHDFMKMLLPTHTARVKQYKEDMPLFYAYGIEEQLLSMHDPVVKLRSGGYIVINPTEALISVDVNSGRSTGERNIEETATKSNIEAAHEIARQLRLRDLAGLIVIDFIDMMDSRNRRAVERNLKDALRSDRAKIQVGRISPFGLMEMSRQRLRPSIGESMHITCPSCQGRGVVRSHESLSLHLMRTLEKEAVSGQWVQLKLLVSEAMAMFLLNHKRRLLTNIETRHGVSIFVEPQHGYGLSEFTIEKIRAPKNKGERGKQASPGRSGPRVDAAALQEDMGDMPLDTFAEEEQTESESADSGREERSGRRGRRTRGGRGRRGGGRKRDEDGALPSSADALPDMDANTDAEQAFSDASENIEQTEGEDRPQRSGRRDRGRGDRGRRGRRRWRGDERDAAGGDAPAEQHVPVDAESLPAFTRSAVIEKKPDNNVVDFPKPEQPPKPIETTSRPEGQPPRKGWWQQIIELD